MKKLLSKTEAKKQIDDFFKHLHDKKAVDVKKIKKLAMAYNVKLGDRRKLFCKKCLSPFVEPSIKIKNGFINIICEHCEHKNRWKLTKELELSSVVEEDEHECC